MFFVPEAVFLQENFAPGQGFLLPQKIPQGFGGGWGGTQQALQDTSLKKKIKTLIAG